MHEGEDALGWSPLRGEYDAEREALAAVARLRDGLDALTEGSGANELTRPNAVALLNVIVESVGPALRRVEGELDDALILTDHPTVVLLMTLIDALRDLDNGKTVTALRAADGANASFTGAAASQRDGLLELVDVLWHARPLVRRRTIECEVAARLRKNGATWKNRKFTAGLLKDLRNRKDRKIR